MMRIHRTTCHGILAFGLTALIAGCLPAAPAVVEPTRTLTRFSIAQPAILSAGGLADTHPSLPIVRPEDGPSAAVSGCGEGEFTSDGRLLVVTCGDQVQLWDVTLLPGAGTPTHVQTWTGQSPEFSPDGRLLALEDCPSLGDCPERQVQLWSVVEAAAGRPAFLLHAFPVQAAKGGIRFGFSGDSRILAVAGPEAPIDLWDTQTFDRRKSLATELLVNALAFNGQGDLLAVSSYGSIELWDVSSGTGLYKLPGVSFAAESAVFSPSGRYLLAYSRALEWREARSGELLAERTLAAPQGSAFSPDGARFAVARQGRIEIWNVDPWQILRSFCGTCQTDGLDLAFSPDGRWLAAFGNDLVWNAPDPLRIWEADGGRLLLEAEASDAVAFHPSGMFLAQTLSRSGGFQLLRLSGVDSTAESLPTPAGNPPIVFNTVPERETEIAPRDDLVLTVQEYELLSGSIDELAGNSGPGNLKCTEIINALTSWPVAAEWQPEPSSGLPPLDYCFYADMDEINRLLSPFGYSLEASSPEEITNGQTPYRLRKGDQVLEIFGFEPPVVSPDGTDFAWLVHDESARWKAFDDLTRDGWLVQRNGWHPIVGVREGPAYLGGQLLIVRYENGNVVVEIDGRSVYSEAIGEIGEPPHLGYCPVRSLEVDDGHWRLHTLCNVILDGVSLRSQAGVDEVYSWRLLGGEPFYLFHQGGEVGVHFAGHNLPLAFDYVYHTFFPVSGATCRVWDFIFTDDIVWFFAQREGRWYLVKVIADRVET